MGSNGVYVGKPFGWAEKAVSALRSATAPQGPWRNFAEAAVIPYDFFMKTEIRKPLHEAELPGAEWNSVARGGGPPPCPPIVRKYAVPRESSR